MVRVPFQMQQRVADEVARLAQRMLAARTESDALFGTFMFQAMHYALRPWPWIVVALASTIVYPSLHDISARFPGLSPNLLGNDVAYPAMLVFLPAGFAGFMPDHALLIATLVAVAAGPYLAGAAYSRTLAKETQAG